MSLGNEGFFVGLGVGRTRIDAKHPENGFFFVATVATAIDTDGGELASFAPAFDGKGGDTEELGNFGHRQEIGKVV